MSRDVDQSAILAVLRDRIAADGAPSEAVRSWVAQELAGVRIAGPWELSSGRHGAGPGGNPRYRCWLRYHVGQPIGCVASLHTGGRLWEGSAGSLSLQSWVSDDTTDRVHAPVENLPEGMALLDAELVADGWLLLPAVARICLDCMGYGFVRETVCRACRGDGEDHRAETLRQQLREAGLEEPEPAT